MTRRLEWGPLLGATMLLALLVFMMLSVVLGPDPVIQDVPRRLSPPDMKHIFGTDHLGRDFASRVAWAMTGSLGIALVVTLVSGIGGGLIGILAGMIGGVLDTVVQRYIDALMSVPLIVAALAAVAVFGSNWWVVAASLSVAFLPLPLRVARSSAMSLRHSDFVNAARVSGAGSSRIVVRHIGVNVAGPWMAIVAAQAGGALLAESALAFVGVSGGRSLGALLGGEAQAFMHVAPWLAVFPGAVIFLVALSVNLLGRGLGGPPGRR